MKQRYLIKRDSLCPPVSNRELALFTCAMQSVPLREWLASRGVVAPECFEIVHQTGNDDPPDLAALGLGWECTEFPPNQSAIAKVHSESGPMGMVIPGFSQTGRDIRQIRAQSVPFSCHPRFCAIQDEIDALTNEFLSEVIGGTKSKDVHGNDVLLLDRRGNHAADLVETALRRALHVKQPRHIQLILLVGWRRYQIGDTYPIPDVVQVFPFNT